MDRFHLVSPKGRVLQVRVLASGAYSLAWLDDGDLPLSPVPPIWGVEFVRALIAAGWKREEQHG